MSEAIQLDRLLARAGFGARPGDREQLAGQGAEAWLADQLAPRREPTLERRLKHFRTLDAPGRVFEGLELPAGRKRVDSATRRELRRRSREATRDVLGARLVRAVHSKWQLREVMVDFWSNHFNVFARKGPVGALLPHYEREVIGRHALGRFSDLLLATAKSPAMLFYLDNWRSTAGRARRRGGINENYARELLELHTLGIDGGYTQEDVGQVARVFTGWTLESRHRPAFSFRGRWHDTGRKRVLGERVRGEGIEQGEWLLLQLARRPETARFISRKLAARFVADDPPPELVERAARRFLASDGEIAELLRVILLSPEFADAENRKLKTPLRFATSALRATDGDADGDPIALHAIARLGEAPYFWRTPDGHPESAEHWVDPAAMLERMQLAFALAADRLPGAWLGKAWPHASSRARGLSRSEALAVALSAPEFQWA